MTLAMVPQELSMRCGITISVAMVLMIGGSFASGDEVPQPDAPPQSKIQLRLRFGNRAEGQVVPAKYSAGEQIPLAVRAEGITTGDDDKIDVLASVELLDQNGKVIKPLCSERANFTMSLGGKEFSFGLNGFLPADIIGNHRIRVSIKDQLSGEAAAGELQVLVEDREVFALVHLRTTIDEQLKVPTDAFPVGRKAFVAFVVPGCAIADGKSMIETSVTVLDQDGKPIHVKPLRVSGSVDQPVYATSGVMNGFVVVGMNRIGDFVLRVRVRDGVSGKEVSRDLAVRVVDLANWPVEVVASKDDGSVKR